MNIVGTIDADNPSLGDVIVEYTDENGIEGDNMPTNWSFGQLSQLAGSAGYLKDLPAPMVADCLQWGCNITDLAIWLRCIAEAIQVNCEPQRVLTAG